MNLGFGTARVKIVIAPRFNGTASDCEPRLSSGIGQTDEADCPGINVA
jgi:hypothetical protein